MLVRDFMLISARSLRPQKFIRRDRLQVNDADRERRVSRLHSGFDTIFIRAVWLWKAVQQHPIPNSSVIIIA